MVLIGGQKGEGPIRETLAELGLRQNRDQHPRTDYNSRYHFKLTGYDINREMNRKVSFDIARAEIEVCKTPALKKNRAAALTGRQTVTRFKF